MQVAHGSGLEAPLHQNGRLNNDVVVSDEIVANPQLGEGGGGARVVLVACCE